MCGSRGIWDDDTRIARPCTIQGYAYVILPRAFRMQGGTCRKTHWVKGVQVCSKTLWVKAYREYREISSSGKLGGLWTWHVS